MVITLIFLSLVVSACMIGKTLMDASHRSPPTNSADMQMRTLFTDALRYWEKMRIVYNLVLAAIVFYHLSSTGSRMYALFEGHTLIGLSILAIIANILYTTAYLIDIPVQLSEFQNRWRKLRWGLFVIGTYLASVFTWLFSRGIRESLNP